MNRIRLNGSINTGNNGNTRNTSNLNETLEGESLVNEYKVRVYHPSSQPFNPDNEWTTLLIDRKGKEYSGLVTTLSFLDDLFKKNQKTGELSEGTYFPVPDRLIILKSINAKNLVRAIDDLIKNNEFEHYFKS